jgi:ABC-2 type transport system ATP-binding protein
LLRSLVENGTSVLLSSHLLNEVQQVCDRIAVLNQGRVVAQGRVAELLNAQKTAVRLRVANSGEATQALQTMPGVDSIRADGEWIIVSGVESQAVMNHLLRQNIIPQEITAHKTDLESLFMDVTSAN